MSDSKKLVEDWRAMKSTLEQHLEAIDQHDAHDHAPTAKETIQRWIVELDDLIIKYSFEV
jgi:hypothetical protein